MAPAQLETVLAAMSAHRGDHYTQTAAVQLLRALVANGAAAGALPAVRALLVPCF